MTLSEIYNTLSMYIGETGICTTPGEDEVSDAVLDALETLSEFARKEESGDN